MNLAEALAGLTAYLDDPALIAALLLAVPLGMLAGLIPGMGGKLAIIMAIPFLVGVDPTLGAVFLLAMHSVVHTGGPIPSILIGVPGTGPDAATVVDGHPMARRGEAGRALGAALASSCVGGMLGAAALALLLPVVRPLVLALGPPEIFLLALLGITFMAAMSGGQLQRGLMVGCLGLLVAFVGMDPMGGVARFTFGQLFLWDGVDLITAIIGLFAIPEILALSEPPGSTATRRAVSLEPGGLRRGMLDVWRHRYLTLRASLIGTSVGMLPGLGGEVASWVAYGHAAQSAQRPDEFGQGRVEGVIAPEAANNSKEGGSLLPTLFFGIPGSSGMAVLLGAFVSLGISPGAAMAQQGLTLVWTLIWALVLANMLSVAVFLAASPHLARVSAVPGRTLFPHVLAFALLGAWLGASHWQALPMLFLFGMLGQAFKHHGWPRGPFAIGLVLGTPAEVALHQTWAIWGAGFLTRPLSLVLLALLAASVIWTLRRHRHAVPPNDPGLLAAMLALFSGAGALSAGYPPPSSIFPLIVAIAGFALAAHALYRQRGAKRSSPGQAGQADWQKSAWSWFAAMTATGTLLGLSPGLPVMLALYRWRQAPGNRVRALSEGLLLALMLEGVFGAGLGLDPHRGLFGARPGWIESNPVV